MKALAGIMLAVICISCNPKMPPPPVAPPQPEALSVFWEQATPIMEIGETRKLQWNSNRPIQPFVHCEGSAVVITGMTHNGVYVRAFEGGTDILSLRIDEQEVLCVITVNDDISGFIIIDEPAETDMNIIIPYTREYLSPGQETKITVRLDNNEYGDERLFIFTKEPGKNSIEIDSLYNVATIKAVTEGEQYVRISHPRASVSRIITYDVLPPAPPPPPEIDLSESPMIIRKGETKALHLFLLNGTAADRNRFRFQVIENAYSIAVTQQGSTLQVSGIAPGAGKIRISNPAVTRDYDVMIIVD